MITKFKKFETKETELSKKYSDITSYIEEKFIDFLKIKNAINIHKFKYCEYLSEEEPNNIFFTFGEYGDEDLILLLYEFLEIEKIKIINTKYYDWMHTSSSYEEVEVYVDDKKLDELYNDYETYQDTKKYNL